MLIGIFSGRVPVKVENFGIDLLHLRLDAVIKLGFTNSHSLESELRLTQKKPHLDAVWPERGQIHCDRIEPVGGRESGRNSLDTC